MTRRWVFAASSHGAAMIMRPARPIPMTRPRRRRAATGTSTRLLELATLAPAVAGARLARMALEGATPSARGRSDMVAMVLEKQVAFAQAWSAMWAEAWRQQMRLGLAWMTTAPTAGQAARMVDSGVRRIAAKGLAPVHRRVVANARRLR